MATTIQNLRSLTAGNQPGDLAPGELAFNLADGFMYLGNGGNNYIDTLGQIVGPSGQPGGGWQQAIFNAAPINGSVTLAGIYDAQDNLITSVTAAGTAAGFATGALPAAAPGNEGYYLLVQIGGTLTPPAPTGDAAPGDWLVSSGTGWALVQESSVVIPASNVSVVPTGDFTGPTMQDVLNQIILQYVPIAGGAISFLNVNGNLEVFNDTTLGDASTDSLTVNATSAFAAPVSLGSTLTVTGAVSCSSTLSVQTNATIQGNLICNGNTTLGNQSTDTVTVAGPITANNNLTVSGATALNGSTQVTGALTTTGSVSITGSAGVTLGANLSTSGAIGITINSAATVTNNASTTFTNSGSVAFNGNVQLNAGGNAKVVTYSRPLSGSSGGIVNENLNNFLVVPGTIIAYGGTGTPAGYLVCDGTFYQNTSTYADLFNAIGYTWGGSGINFAVPDLRGMFVRGAGTNTNPNYKTTTGQSPIGPAVGQAQKDNFQAHRHSLTLHTGDYGASFKSDVACLMLNNDQMQGVSGGRNNIDRDPITQAGGQPIGMSPTVSGVDETRSLSAGVRYLIKY